MRDAAPAALLLSCLVAFLACEPKPRSTAESPAPTNPPAGEVGAPPEPSRSPACDTPGARLGMFDQQVPVFGKDRRYTLSIPKGYDPKVAYPVVYVLHGHGGNGMQARGAFNLEAAANGRAIFVYPDGIGGKWDLDSPASKNADVALFDASLAQTQSGYCVDLHRVFVAGFSNGAYMANQLACRRGDRIRAVATHSGGGPYEPPGAGEYDAQGQLACKGKPVASLIIHGAADGTVAPKEGEKSIAHWAHANHCEGSTPTTPAGCSTFKGCSNQVVSCKVAGLGHGIWPQAKQVAWSFFDAQK